MDSDQYLPIATIANLEQIQELTTDLQLVVQLLRGKSQLMDASHHTLFNFFNLVPGLAWKYSYIKTVRGDTKVEIFIFTAISMILNFAFSFSKVIIT